MSLGSFVHIIFGLATLKHWYYTEAHIGAYFVLAKGCLISFQAYSKKYIYPLIKMAGIYAEKKTTFPTFNMTYNLYNLI